MRAAATDWRTAKVPRRLPRDGERPLRVPPGAAGRQALLLHDVQLEADARRAQLLRERARAVEAAGHRHAGQVDGASSGVDYQGTSKQTSSEHAVEKQRGCPTTARRTPAGSAAAAKPRHVLFYVATGGGQVGLRWIWSAMGVRYRRWGTTRSSTRSRAAPTSSSARTRRRRPRSS